MDWIFRFNRNDFDFSTKMYFGSDNAFSNKLWQIGSLVNVVELVVYVSYNHKHFKD